MSDLIVGILAYQPCAIAVISTCLCYCSQSSCGDRGRLKVPKMLSSIEKWSVSPRIVHK
ncbi:MAG TPA: hypothetical protein V6C91_17160 [Coleofasciculaceae cyanobacterium]